MSVYDKDMGKLWFVLILTIVGSVSLLRYSYSYNLESSNKQDALLTTIYNSGENTCKITNNTIYNEVECKFTVMGYNKTNENGKYKIDYIRFVDENDQNNTINSNLIKIDLINKKQSINLESISLEGIEKKSLILKEVEIPANSSDIFDGYIIRMSIDSDNFFSNYLNNGQFKINIDVIY